MYFFVLVLWWSTISLSIRTRSIAIPSSGKELNGLQPFGFGVIPWVSFLEMLTVPLLHACFGSICPPSPMSFVQKRMLISIIFSPCLASVGAIPALFTPFTLEITTSPGCHVNLSELEPCHHVSYAILWQDSNSN